MLRISPPVMLLIDFILFYVPIFAIALIEL